MKLEKLVSEGSYIEAKHILEEEGVGEVINTDAADDGEGLLTRKRYRELIEKEARNFRDELNRQGKPRGGI